MGVKRTTEEYKQALEEFNKKNNTNIKLKEGVEYIDNNTKIIHICSCGKEWNVRPGSILSAGNKKCKLCYTLVQWGIDNLGEDFLEKYWDWEKNNELGNNPWEIPHRARTDIYIYCQKVDYHGSYKINTFRFTTGGRCSYCHSKQIHPQDSFAQYLIDTYGENALDLYWDYKNNQNIDPYKLSKKSHTNIYIICQEKDYHDSYPIICADFVEGSRCPYCSHFHGKVHLLDSLGTLYPQVLDIWSEKNKKSPYEYSIKSAQRIYWKCPEGKHEDYPKEIYNALKCDFRCPDCSNEQRESIMATTLKQVLKHEYPDTIWEHDVGFRTPKNYIGRYDIYSPQLDNLLIECQSEYHDNPKQQEIDRLKKEYAINNNYNYLAIDKRDYSPLQAVQLFFPEIKEIPDYVDISKNTYVYWDVDLAQKLINEYYSIKSIAKIINVPYTTLQSGILRDSLNIILPEDYHRRTNSQYKKIVCLTKDGKFIKEYYNITSAKIDFGNKKSSNISICLLGKTETAYGYKWMYFDEYVKYKNKITNSI